MNCLRVYLHILCILYLVSVWRLRLHQLQPACTTRSWAWSWRISAADQNSDVEAMYDNVWNKVYHIRRLGLLVIAFSAPFQTSSNIANMLVRKKCPARQNTAPQVRRGAGVLKCFIYEGFMLMLRPQEYCHHFRWMLLFLFVSTLTSFTWK